jgi:hypothetical protein
MTKKNHTIIAIEDGVPGCPRINHLAIHKACDRFLAKRGLHNPGFRRSEWLFGRPAIGQRRAAA